MLLGAKAELFLSYLQPLYFEGIYLKDMVYFYRDLS